MKKLLSLLALLAFVSATTSRAQTYDLRFVPEVRADVLALRVQIRLDSGSRPLGTSNLVFTFDHTEVSFPEDAVAGVDYQFLAFDASTDPTNYGSSTVTLGTEGLISVNVLHQMTGTGTSVETTFMDVAEIYFAILDSDAATTFTWNAVETSVFDAEAVGVEWAQDELVDLNDAALPVEMVSFEAQLNGPAVQVSWATASETNNAGFDVQYALADSARFVSAGFVEGHGTTNEAQAYAFQFNPAQLGTYRIRLKQVDFDGSFSYSPEVELAVTQLPNAGNGEPVAFTLSQPTPNPFHSSTSLTLQLMAGQQVQAVLFNALGQEVRTVLDAYVSAGSTQRMTIEGTSLSPGLYVLQVQGEKFAETRQLVLVR